jgi:cytochrome c peroxidase
MSRLVLVMMCLAGCGAPRPAPSPLLAALAPASLPAPPPDRSNRFADDARAAALGRRWFADPGFSGPLLDGDNDGSAHALGRAGETGKVACAGCHLPDGGFSDTRSLAGQISLGAAWGKRRAPSLYDVGQAKLLMWDGRHDALYNQPFGPIESYFEMNSSRLYVAEQIYLRYKDDYEAVFGPLPDFSDTARFPRLAAAQAGCAFSPTLPPPVCHGVPGDHAELDGLSPADRDAVTAVVVNFGKALGAYERRLGCGPSRFDAWVHGQADALNDAEQRGAALFVGKGGCVTCHAGPFFSDQRFHNVGLQPTLVATVFVDANDEGAQGGVTAAIADPLDVRGQFSDGDDGRLPMPDAQLLGAFRTPTLRCVGRRPSFMHTGQLLTLEEVVAFFVAGGDAYGYLGTSELHPLSLSRQEQADLVAFLRALDGPGATGD